MRMLVLQFSILLFLIEATAQLLPIGIACIGNSITQGENVKYPSVLGQLLGSHYI